MQLFYHYTSLEAFKNIVESKTLWLTNSAFLNDSTEIINGKDFFNEITEITLNELEIKRVKDFFRQFINDLTKPFDNYEMYIIPFCKEGDKKSQWVQYAPQGIAIGFEKSVFPIDYNEIYQLNDCLYTHESKRKAIIELLTDDIFMTKMVNIDNKSFDWKKEWGEEWGKILDIVGQAVIHRFKKLKLSIDFDKELLYTKILMYAQFKILALLARFKDEGFEDEKEVRFVRIIGKDEVNKISSRVCDNKFIPHTFLPIELSSIKQIIFGPSVNSKNADAIKQFVAKNKIDCEFINSKIPLQL